MKKYILLTLLSLLSLGSAFAQRKTDALDRGLVAVPSGSGNLVSWRVLGEEYYDVTYNLYRDGSKIADNLSASNYLDNAGNASSQYQVAAVVRGVEKEKSAAITQWAKQYKSIPVVHATDRNGNDVNEHYTLNDVTLGDLTGNGVTEFIVKRPCNDASDINQSTRFNQLDCYDINGNRLWWIDLGPNMIAGPDEQWDAIAYDWDQDGKAEVLMRCADDVIIHFADGTTQRIGESGVDTRYNGIQYTYTGKEYLVYLEGATGKPYQIMEYPIARGADADWGTGIVGHRSSKHYFGAPFLDGRHPSIFLGRGAYTKHKMMAYDVNPATHQLTKRWEWECTDKNSPWFGQGYHNYAVGDVDWDGRDEIIFGSMVIDDNGKGLSTTGLGHGDSQHCADFDPFRKYEEQFACNEDKPGMNYRNAVTAELYKRTTAGNDDGRALMGNFTNDYPGSVGRSVSTGKMLSSVSDQFISELTAEPFIPWAKLNSRIYWDGDLLDEYMDGNGNENVAADIYKAGGGRLFRAEGTAVTNSTKRNFCAQGDIFGDWREELVLRSSDNTELRIYATNIPTEYRIPTLWHDHQYRNAMVWQTMGYNQTPHKSYFLGELEGITQAPPPLTMTGRTEIANGGTITTTNDHLLVCETGNTSVNIADGASPYIVTFNVPSWVQGSAESNCASQTPAITYHYYTCNVTGGALSGATRLVKQGDGILNLPKVTMVHTGNTDVWGGTVNFDGTMQNSAMWMNRHTTLNTKGGSFNSLKMEYGSTLDITGSATVGTLEMHEGARIKISKDAGENIAITDFIVRDQKWQYGPQYLAPVFEIESASELTNGAKFQIGTVSGSVPENINKVIVESNIAIGKQGKLIVEDGKLYISVGDDENLMKRVGTETTVYERGYETAWTTSDAATAADVSAEYGVHQAGGNGDNAKTISINPTIGNTVALEAYWVGMSNTGRNFSDGNYSYFRYGNILLMENDQDQAVAYSLDGGATYKTFGGNSTWANRKYDISEKNWMVIRMEIDTENNVLNYLKVYSSSDLTSPLLTVLDESMDENFDYKTVAIGYKKGGSVSTTNNEYLKKLKVTEASYTYVYAGAQYKVQYVDETGATVKPTETRMGVHGYAIELTEEDKEEISTTDGKNKWVYASDNAGTLAEDGSTVVTVTFNKLYKYSVTAVDENSEVIANIKSDYLDDADNITVFYDYGMMVDGKVYMTAANASAPYFGTVVNKSNLTKTIYYTYNPDIKYYAEAEDAETTRTYGSVTNDDKYSGGAGVGVYQDARTYGEKVEAGVYDITVKGIIRKASGNQTYSIRISNDNTNFTEVGTITFANAATGEKKLTGITIPEGYFVDIYNSVSGNAYNYLDYFYLTQKSANYVVKFTDKDGNTIKQQETRTGGVGSIVKLTEADMTQFNSADGLYSYVYTSTSPAEPKVLENGSLVVTVVFEKRDASIDYIGNTNFSTGFWGDFSDTYTLQDGEKYHFVFKNYNNGGTNWQNWILAVVNGTGHSITDRSDYAEHFVLRNDNYAWGPEGNYAEDEAFKSLTEMQSNFNWSKFVSDMNGATVDMYVTYENSKVSVASTIKGSSGSSYNYSFSKKNITDSSVSMFFTVENSYIMMTKAEKVVSVDEPTNVISGGDIVLLEEYYETNSRENWTTSISGRENYAWNLHAGSSNNHYLVANASGTNGATLTYSGLTKVTDYYKVDNYNLSFDFAILPLTTSSNSGAQTSRFTIKSNTGAVLASFSVVCAAKTSPSATSGDIYINESTSSNGTFSVSSTPIFYTINIAANEDGTVMTVEAPDGTTQKYTLSNNIVYVGNWTYETGKSYGGLCLDNIVLTSSKSSSLTLYPLSDDEYEPGVYASVTLNRSFKAGYSTLCVPFNTTVEELTGGDEEAYVAHFSNVEMDESGSNTLIFTNGTEIVANRPYIIYLSKPLAAPVFHNKAVYAENAKSITVGDWTMTGNYEADKSMSGLYGVAKNSSIMKGGSNSTLNGFTAFIQGPASAMVKSRFTNTDDDATDISDMVKKQDSPAVVGIFTIGGVRIPSLQKGINIIRMSDGTVKKHIIK